jgi:DsbE subfamily thiol:disulfide oxidoreductase
MWGAGQTPPVGPGAADSDSTTGESSLFRISGRVQPGQMAPDFTLTLLDGSRLALADLQGQVVLVNFWATWCEPCEDELPDLQRLWEAYRDEGVMVVGIAEQPESAEVEEMTSRLGVTYPLGLDPENLVAFEYGITGVPETFLVDAEGHVTYFHIGPVTFEELQGELDALLAEQE